MGKRGTMTAELTRVVNHVRKKVGLGIYPMSSGLSRAGVTPPPKQGWVMDGYYSDLPEGGDPTITVIRGSQVSDHKVAWVILHEYGHFLAGHNEPSEMDSDGGIAQEREAWEVAFSLASRLGFEVSEDDAKMTAFFLSTYGDNESAEWSRFMFLQFHGFYATGTPSMKEF